MSQLHKRAQIDVNKLITSDYKVDFTVPDLLTDFVVEFHGPKDTPYEDGLWKVRINLPDNYPLKSPSVVFANRIFHPNIDWDSGSVCLDVINQTWSPMYGLINIFDVFLPQLLTYPNPDDPMNVNAASLWKNAVHNNNMHGYEQQIRDLTKLYASNSDKNSDDVPMESNDCSDMSSLDSD